MSEDKNQVGVIHEVGDFGLIGELSQEDQKAFKEKDKKVWLFRLSRKIQSPHKSYMIYEGFL